MLKTRKITFSKELLEKRVLPPIYDKVSFRNNLLYDGRDTANFADKIVVVQDIPGYLDIKTKKGHSRQSIKVVKTIKGHLIDFKNINNLTDYLTYNFSPKSRSNLRRHKNRIEKCFKINYRIYFGAIEKQEYDKFFSLLRFFLTRRFDQKREKNYELQHLDEFQRTIYPLILKRKANMYVIYNDKTPISIRINMLFGNLAYYIISGYDIDFSKFQLGAIDMLKNIEWCIANNMEIYDLLKGYDYYKKRWATKAYFNYQHITYNKNHFPSFIVSNLKHIKVKLKYNSYKLLKNSFLETIYKNFKKTMFNGNSERVNFNLTSELDATGEFISIDFNDSQYAQIKRPVYDFLFLTNDFIDNIKVFKINQKPNQYIIEGRTTRRLLTLS